MAQLDTREKLAILADAAKYDASCASSGTSKRDSRGGKGVGSTEGMGICHAYAPDGRCISLLKILLTNSCIFDCHYCINRKSSNVRRARFTAEEVVKLTIAFYKRNYIEGLFLSSGIIASSNYTMEQLVEVARALREDHDFRGYIHLKTIPDADPELVRLAGLHADRVSINVELPTRAGLERLAPEKSQAQIEGAMAGMKASIVEAKDNLKRFKSAPRFAPAGQSTQMIVGADATDDQTILTTAETLYSAYKLKRVYYSAFSPIPQSPKSVPLQPPPMMREHRLYQADFLVRSYGFQVPELLPASGNLALDIDPKLAWALSHREHFPMDLNTADLTMISRVPGIGMRNAKRLVELRRMRRIRYADETRLRCSMKKIQPFIVTADYRPARDTASSESLRRAMAEKPQQLDMWADLPALA